MKVKILLLTLAAAAALNAAETEAAKANDLGQAVQNARSRRKPSTLLNKTRSAAGRVGETYWTYGLGPILSQLAKDLADAFVVTADKPKTRKTLRALSLVSSLTQATALGAGAIAPSTESNEPGADLLRRALLVTGTGLEIAEAADAATLIKNDARYGRLLNTLGTRARRRIRATRLKNMGIRLGISSALMLALIGLSKKYPDSYLSNSRGGMTAFSILNVVLSSTLTNEKKARFDLEAMAKKRKISNPEWNQK